jgi:hypothetical protein
LTFVQERTLRDLMSVRRFPVFEPSVASGLRDRLQALAGELGLTTPLWLSKERLTDRTRCEGLFLAGLEGRRPPFAHSNRTAPGALFHRSIELDVGAAGPVDARVVAEKAAGRLREERAFDGYWEGLDPLERGELLTEAVRRLELFRASFPPLERSWAPVPEQRLRADLAGGLLVLSGRVDLMLGPPGQDPRSATRLVIDLKSGDARPEYVEDLRFYALLMCLRVGVPPYRVASFFLDSGEWQAEDVTVGTLEHAADRVQDAARTAAALRTGSPPSLRAGHHCGWCPERPDCPAAAAAFGPVAGA